MTHDVQPQRDIDREREGEGERRRDRKRGRRERGRGRAGSSVVSIETLSRKPAARLGEVLFANKVS